MTGHNHGRIRSRHSDDARPRAGGPTPTRRTARTRRTGRGRGAGRTAAGRPAVVLLCLAGLAVAFGVHLAWGGGPGGAAAGPRGGAADVTLDGPDPGGGSAAAPSSAGSTAGAPARGASGGTPAIPQTGPGTFTTAPGRSRTVGSGKVLRYEVEVEDGVDVSAADAARQVEAVLADPRGWTANGTSAFERVSSGPTDFTVKIATPGTVDRICGRYGLDTGGEVNCDVGRQVMVNLKRWLLATPVYAHDVTSYRALIINHEVGHFLGHGHETCPGKGQPAPVMMQQIKGLHGCRTNVWPYTADGRPITGPPVP